MKLSLLKIFNKWFSSVGFEEEYATLLASSFSFVLVLILAIIVYQILNRVIIRNLKKLADKTKIKWDNVFFDFKVFKWLSHIFPAIIIYSGTATSLEAFPGAIIFFQRAASLYMIVAAILVIESVINSLHQIYNLMSVSRNRSIKGYVQVVKIFLYVLGTGIVLSILLQKDLTTFFAGLGAMAAVLMLVFKDSILGLVAGVQLSANDMVRLGDWVQMDSRKADGAVIDISLNTVKIQNWDKTISTIPTYALVSESFTNWRGMEESGGRRIKRCVHIDMSSIHFLSKQEIEKLKKIQIIKGYLEQKELEIEMYNAEHGIDGSLPVNGRHLTNLGTFRKYVEEFLKRHPKISKDMTFLVRHLQPDEKGIPIEIYVFCNDIRWAYYEEVQADIFDHILAIIPHFDLRIFQNPTGEDIGRLAQQYQHVSTDKLVGLE